MLCNITYVEWIVLFIVQTWFIIRGEWPKSPRTSTHAQLGSFSLGSKYHTSIIIGTKAHSGTLVRPNKATNEQKTILIILKKTEKFKIIHTLKEGLYSGIFGFWPGIRPLRLCSNRINHKSCSCLMISLISSRAHSLGKNCKGCIPIVSFWYSTRIS